MLNYTVQELATRYAEALVTYHKERLVGDRKTERRAYDALCLAQNLLDSACIRAAELAGGLVEKLDVGCEFDGKLA